MRKIASSTYQILDGSEGGYERLDINVQVVSYSCSSIDWFQDPTVQGNTGTDSTGYSRNLRSDDGGGDKEDGSSSITSYSFN